MRAGNVYWLIAAIAVAAVTIALAAFIVVLTPGDPNLAAAAVQQQVLEPKLESIAESHSRARVSPPASAAPPPHRAGVGDDASAGDLGRLSFAAPRGQDRR